MLPITPICHPSSPCVTVLLVHVHHPLASEAVALHHSFRAYAVVAAAVVVVVATVHVVVVLVARVVAVVVVLCYVSVVSYDIVVAMIHVAVAAVMCVVVMRGAQRRCEIESSR